MKIFFNQQNVTSDIEAIQAAGNVLLLEECVKPEFIDACIEREKLYPTGLLLPTSSAIAMPHGESKYVFTDSISIIRTTNPVRFKRMDDPEVEVECQLVFNLALSSGEKHLSILRRLMALFQDETFIERCLQDDEKQILSYVKKQIEV